MIRTPCDMKIGADFTVKSGDILTVVKYRGARLVDYEFKSTGYRSTTTADNIRRGHVKNRLIRTTFGVGYCTGRNSRDDHPKAYDVWRGILRRCYSPWYINKKAITYKDVTVCDDWLSFDNFCDWFVDNYVDGYCIDKDYKSPDGKIYSPDTCAFVPQYINNILLDRRSARGKFPTGVNYDKRNRKYKAQIIEDGKIKFLGLHETPELAERAYMKEKSEKIYRALKRYKDDVAWDEGVHIALSDIAKDYKNKSEMK